MNNYFVTESKTVIASVRYLDYDNPTFITPKIWATCPIFVGIADYVCADDTPMFVKDRKYKAGWKDSLTTRPFHTEYKDQDINIELARLYLHGYNIVEKDIEVMIPHDWKWSAKEYAENVLRYAYSGYPEYKLLSSQVRRTPIIIPKSNMGWGKAMVYKFNSGLYRHGSWGQEVIKGTHQSVMTLYINPDNHCRGFIEWDIPELDTGEEIGLWFQKNEAGELVLTDYDGVMAIPDHALDLLKEAGITVSDFT